MLRFIRKHPIVSFSVLAFLVTYLVGLPWVILTQDLEKELGLREEMLSLLFMRGGPTIAGLIVVFVLARGRGLMVWLKQLVRWRAHPGYYAMVACLVTIPFVAAVLAIMPLEQLQGSPDLAAGRNWPAVGVAYLQEAAYRILTNGEETGWRFAMLPLLLARMRLMPAVLVVAIVWAFWHMPAFFLFGQAALWYPLIPICLCWSVLFGWLYLRTDSLLLCLIAHGAANATFYTFEAHFPNLSAQWDALEPLGDWVYSIVPFAFVLILLIVERRLFFGPVQRNADENWVGQSGNAG